MGAIESVNAAATGIAWELRRKHRHALIALTLYFAALALFRLFVVGRLWNPTLSQEWAVAAVVVVPMAATFTYLMAAFSFGFEGDFGARESLFPKRWFTLPVESADLVRWPMLYGCIAMAVVWFANRLLGMWPADAQVPLVWPALGVVVLVAWTQAIAWMPYGVRGLRVLVTVVWLTLVAATIFIALESRPSEAWMMTILAPQVPLAYVVARIAVVRARRGDTPDWRGSRQRAQTKLDVATFGLTSPEAAQRWYEWRLFGRSLPIMVAIVLPFELGLLFVFSGMPRLVGATLLGVMLTPPLLGAFVAASVGRSGAVARGAYELSPFVATRPLSSEALVAAKLYAVARSAAMSWFLIAVVTPPALWLSGNAPIVAGEVRALAASTSMERVGAALVLAAVGLFVFTFRQLLRTALVGLSGRPRLVRVGVFATLALWTTVAALAPWVFGDIEIFLAFWRALPWILGALAVAKLVASWWVTRALTRRGLRGPRKLLVASAVWVVAVAGVYMVADWILALPASLPPTLPMLAAILFVPLVRPLALPLAMDANRHRGGVRPLETASTVSGYGAVGVVMAVLLAAPVVVTAVTALEYDLRTRTNGVLVSSGEQREYLLHVPSTYDAASPAPLVISFHGGATWPAQQMQMSGWNDLADRHGFLVVYPAGTGFPRRWHTFEVEPGLDRDVRFIADLIESLRADYNLDPNRTFVNGLSNGGGMSFVLSCRLPEEVAAVGVVAPAQTLPPDWCDGAPPIPMIAFQGDEDHIVPYEGGPMGGAMQPVRPVFPAIEDFVSRWARRNGCAEGVSANGAGDGVTRMAYGDCELGADVELFTIAGGGHTWPGGEPLPDWFVGATSSAIDATSKMWEFFVAHPRRR